MHEKTLLLTEKNMTPRQGKKENKTKQIKTKISLRESNPVLDWDMFPVVGITTKLINIPSPITDVSMTQWFSVIRLPSNIMLHDDVTLP